MKTALYMRVSTNDQTNEPQRQELTDFATRRGWVNTVEYADTISGAKFTRTGLDRLLADVRRGKVERVVVVKLDRLGRSLPHLAQLIGELDGNRVALVATSQAIDTSHDNPAGRLQMHVLMAVAEFERSLIRERTRAGMKIARLRGVSLGRRKTVLNDHQQRALSMWQNKPSTIRALASELKVSIGTAHRLANEVRASK